MAMDEAFVRSRISQLRIKKGVSEYRMSTDLGHSKSYIQSISSGKSLPSFSEFLLHYSKKPPLVKASSRISGMFHRTKNYPERSAFLSGQVISSLRAAQGAPVLPPR